MLLKRIITVVIGAPFVIGTILCPEVYVFESFVAVCLLVALWEFFTIVGFSGRERIVAVSVGFIHVVFLLFCPMREGQILLDSVLVVFAAFAFYCFSIKETTEGIAQKVALIVLGVFYVGTFGAFVGLVRELPNGAFWVFALLGMTWFNDTAAYFFGHRFGRRKLAPKVSPGKTLEGFLGGFLGSFLGFLLFWGIFKRPVPFVYSLPLTLLVGTLGPIGDLCESLIKRSFHVKDSGNVIPGHGGMLDRIDALLFTAPVVYFFVRYL